MWTEIRQTTCRDGRDRSDGMVTPVWGACVKPSTYMSRVTIGWERAGGAGQQH